MGTAAGCVAVCWFGVAAISAACGFVEIPFLGLESQEKQPHPSLPVPIFTGVPPKTIPKGHVIKLHSTQIQYSQTVMLNFNGLTWPHVSVATLAPAHALPVPPSAWA